MPPVAIDPSWVVGELADVSELKAANPYLRDRELRSLSVDIPLGPDWREQHLHSVTASADQVQVRKDTQASGLGPLLPRGLPPGKYAMCAAALVTGQSMEVALPDDLEWAIRLSAGLVPGVPLKSVRKWRKTVCGILKDSLHLEVVSPLKAQFDCRKSESFWRACPGLHPDRLALAVASLNWPDHDLPILCLEGSRLLGPLSPSHIFRPAVVEPLVTLEELLVSAPMYVAQVLARPKPPEAQVQTVWAKTVQEATEGTRVMEGPYTKSQIDELHGVGGWRPVVRFATQERSGKYRVIDNGRAGSQNDVTGAEERIHTCSSAASAAIARRFRGLLGTSLQGDMALRSSTEDMKSAFRQLPVHPESLRFTIIAVWHPEWNTWSFWRLFGMPFGLKGAVLDFNRVSAALLALARRWLAIPSLSFFDDFRNSGNAGFLSVSRRLFP